MELIPIGAAAERLGLSRSALRYYDERGLVRPARRQHGMRMYGRAELRRLALLKLAQRLGIQLDTAAAMLDGPRETWQAEVRVELGRLDELLVLATGARAFLTRALDCTHQHPARDCPNMAAALDELESGSTVDELRARYH